MRAVLQLIPLTVDGRSVEVQRDGVSLLEALRDELGVRAVKDGCSPQGQCGCCTVLVDEAPRVACVTAVRRVAGRRITTVDGLDETRRARLVGAFVAYGASQCGFCTPGILCRLAALGDAPNKAQVETALLAHLCRCTGWRTIVDAACDAHSLCGRPGASPRAGLEGGVPQHSGPDAVLGRGGFADDTAPPGCLVAVPDGTGGWSVADTLAEARLAASRVPGRRSGQQVRYPLEVPPGDWDATLRTTWVEPAYLELDTSWCVPGGEPASPVANGGAFGGKLDSPAPPAARLLANRHGRPVRVVLSREDVVRLGPKRPPVAAGIRADGTGRMRVARIDLADTIHALAPGLEVETVHDVPGPPVSSRLRAAGWAEAAILVAAAAALRDGSAGGPVGRAAACSPSGGLASAAVTVDENGMPADVSVTVSCGDPLDAVTLRSYSIGAAHMALGWVCSEAIAVDDGGAPEDLTIRSFGILRARDTPPIGVDIVDANGPPVKGSDAVLAAVAAACWIAQGLPPCWPTRRGGVR